MNKKRVEGWILTAKEALEICGIAKDGKVDKNFRGQISSFGAAVVMGSLKSAVAFFSEKGGAEVERTKLISAVYYCISKEKLAPKEVLKIVCNSDEKNLKEQFVDASIALKLAMNFYELV